MKWPQRVVAILFCGHMLPTDRTVDKKLMHIFAILGRAEVSQITFAPTTSGLLHFSPQAYIKLTWKNAIIAFCKVLFAFFEL